MPRIFDNFTPDSKLLPALRGMLRSATRADFCVGYFNLRGWRQLGDEIESWPGDDSGRCRLLVGMQRLPQEELRAALSLVQGPDGMDNQSALRLKRQAAEEFRNQLMLGAPSNADEATLCALCGQLRDGKLVVKLHLRHPLHAKLYLLHRPDQIAPIVGYLGSSNLTFSGLSAQGELNVDVVEHDACLKLQRWFDDRWADQWCLDISDDLIQVIEESWAREVPLSPYHVYLKMAYHLSQEARAGLAEFQIPRDFGDRLLDFQKAAVKIAAHHLNNRHGVLIGDVVGLGKTLMATALARIFQDDQGTETLIICPKNLEAMWNDYRERYRLLGRVVPLSQVIGVLPDLRRYRVVLIDESHNLRNREGKQYRAIHEYIHINDSRCILLSATPYNKTYLDLASQLRLFVDPEADLGIRPERLLADLGEVGFAQRHQGSLRTLAAFEKSEHADDWRDLMRRYLVRRTRGFIQDNYAKRDEEGRAYLDLEGGERSYFPVRVPKTAKFDLGTADDPYALLYAQEVVDTINALHLPRYGLGNYVSSHPPRKPKPAEQATLDGLSRAGQRLMGFCRTNLFKRLESGGPTFIQSVERHVLRNYVFLHALERGLPLPLGTQEPELLDTRFSDADADGLIPADETDDALPPDAAALPDVPDVPSVPMPPTTEVSYLARAERVYNAYGGQYKKRFRWLPVDLLDARLLSDALRTDARALLGVLDRCGPWNPERDAKLAALTALLTETHATEKVLVFSQFADTVRYLADQLGRRGIVSLAGVTGEDANPTALAWRFSPVSNDKRDLVRPADELRVLIATDVLSEGQNLQDAAVIVNFDLPWAIIRLIQRAGRVDRIGQEAERILCYSFLPTEGIERIIRLRDRVRQRLRQNAEVVGTDETFFEDDDDDRLVLDLYNEKAGILDGDADTEVDLASYAYQIWKNATDADPKLKTTIETLPDVVYTARGHQAEPGSPHGVLVYARTAEGNDALAWVDETGKSVTESQLVVLRAAACGPEDPPVPRAECHHDLVAAGVKHIVTEEKGVGGQLGRPSGARFKTYNRLKVHAEALRRGQQLSMFGAQLEDLQRAVEDIYRYPLRQTATDALNRQLKAGITDQDLAQLVVTLRADDRLCIVNESEREQEPRILCSLGLVPME
ncbi:MAG: phospholipase D-like domain-containing protein [Chloroflexota bacterium]|nr:phospholipase D-like domain-containing protein [Chloroflexota bacterium]